MIATLPPGTYYIGDPSYIFCLADWEQFQEAIEDVDGEGVIDFMGHAVVIGRTLHGDGWYSDGRGGEYPVDSGLLSVIPLALVLAKGPETSKEKSECLKRCVYLNTPIDVIVHNGVFVIGKLVIDTGFSHNDDDDGGGDDHYHDYDDEFNEELKKE